MAESGWLRTGATSVVGEGISWSTFAALPLETAPDRLLDFAVKSLLSAGGGDRAGLWTAGALPGAGDLGRVVEAHPGPIPEQWKHLDFSHGFLQDALQSSFPLLCGPGLPLPMPHVGPLVGMQKAVWLPIRASRHVFGLALVAYGSAQSPIQLDRLFACAEGIATTLGILRDRQRLEAAGEEIRAHVRISGDILAGVSTAAIFSQIVRAARLYSEADFIALRGTGDSPALDVAADHPAEWRAHLEGELSVLWELVERQGCVVELGRAEFGKRLADHLDGCAGSIDRLIAFPIKTQNRTRAVLLAGLRRTEDTSETRARLAQYTTLAALALDREKRKNEALAWEEACRSIFEKTSECLIEMDATGCIREANRAAHSFFHLGVLDLTGKRLENLFEPSAREAVLRWRQSIEDAVDRKSRPVLQDRLTVDGVTRLQALAHFPAENGAEPSCLIRLQGARPEKTSIEVGSGLQGILLALVGAIDSGVLLLDDAGNIRMVSDRFAQIMETGSRSLLELGTMDRLIDHLSVRFQQPEETAQRWRDSVLQSDPTVHDEFEMVRPAAKVIERLTKPLVGIDGKIAGRLEVYRDITTQRMVQTKLLQAEKMAALGLLVSGIAHELNNPLTSIQGYAQLLSTRSSAAQRQSDVRSIAQEAERAGGIVKNLLLFAREAKPERTLVDLNEIVKRTVALRAYERNLENIRVEMDLAHDLPRTLADAAQMQQVILNLIVNAEQAIREERGSGRIGISTRRLADTRIVLEIVDDGPGIPPEIAGRMFDPFFTTKPAGIGTGLGLSIVYGIVQEHGGEITVESSSNQGTTVRLELSASQSPLDSRPVTQIAQLKTTTLPVALPTSAAWQAEHILVIEDEPTVAQLLADILTGEGYSVDVLLDSRDGLERLRDSDYSLAICDLKMPHVDGPAIFRELGRTGNPMRDRLLFVTGDTLSPRTLEFLNSSGMPYLAKPFLVEELKSIVRHTLASIPAGEKAVLRTDGPREVGRRT
jgi:signal transduction histidine kinase/CheY-like chemotaxis protein